jgi:hypothetical protein
LPLPSYSFVLITQVVAIVSAIIAAPGVRPCPEYVS